MQGGTGMSVLRIAVDIVVIALGSLFVWGCFLLQKDREAERRALSTGSALDK